jgi:hypothetical protein
MTDFTQNLTRTPEEIAAHIEAAGRLRTAILNAQARRRTPKLEAVLTNDGIIIADFYGIRPGGMMSKFGFIHAQFDYDEMEEAITFVENMR